MIGGVDVRGAAPGTRETDLLDPTNLVEQVHSVLLSGGSAFGLEAATGAARWLGHHGFGFPAGPMRVPIVALNAVGDVRDPANGALLAGARHPDGSRGDGATDAILRGELPPAMQAGMATTTGVVATDAVLTKAQARKVAQQSHDGLARTMEPSHTMWDGDTMFALGAMAARVTEAAVLNAVRAATALPGLPSASELA